MGSDHPRPPLHDVAAVDGDGDPLPLGQGADGFGPAPPQSVLELAAACVRFVTVAVKVAPDFTPETLPLVDYYLTEARVAIRQRPETLSLVANSVGVYLGEVVRRQYPCWWRLESTEPLDWCLQFRDVYLSFAPGQVVMAALTRPGLKPAAPPEVEGLDDVLDDSPEPGMLLHPEDRDAVFQRLAELPPVSEDDYYALSTRLEVIDIAVNAILSNLLSQPERQRVHRPADYDDS